MTNKIAISIGIVLLGLLSADFYFNDWSGSLFLLRKLADLIEWMAFWR